MDRRTFVATALSLAAPFPLAAAARGRTRWEVTGSEGYDAIAFLGALSGGALYREEYAAAADAFLPGLPAAVRADLPRLAAEAEAGGFGLLWPSLAHLLSGAGVTDLAAVVALLGDPARARPSFLANPNRDEREWAWFAGRAARLHAVVTAMRDAGFAGFRAARLGAGFDARLAAVRAALAGYDVIRWQEKLTGRRFDPRIAVVLLAFSKPHGAKMQGQVFLQAADYDTATTVRIAAHEMLHPPFAMNGAAAQAALAVLARDPLVTRIVRDHDPKWGYTTLAGLLNEDVCQALDQLIGEALGVARNPRERWRRADDGIHVLAAACYDILRADRWAETGGEIEAWIARAAASGRLAPRSLHAAAGRVLGLPTDGLWPPVPM